LVLLAESFRPRRTEADDRVQVSTLLKRREPSPASRIRSQHYAVLSRTIREVFPGTVVAPYLMLGGSDARHYYPSKHPRQSSKRCHPVELL
jgi:carboxypeptidase PM20D1